MVNPHLVDGEFQSDKYPTTPRGKVPLSTKDPTAQDLLWQYAQRRRAVDAEFADALEAALETAGYAVNLLASPNGWKPVAKEKPRPHARYHVRRGDLLFTATPCYGMHAPWWVPRVPDQGDMPLETAPISMQDDDEWRPLSPAQARRELLDLPPGTTVAPAPIKDAS